MRYEYRPDIGIATLLGKTIVKIDGAQPESEWIAFTTDDGKSYVMYHYQNCCETVGVEDIVGDVADLIGEPILEAEEATSDTDPLGFEERPYRLSFTWTFYKLGTRKGSVTIRWLGESNGYYSERVNFSEASGED